jgi:hypothetical protein
VLVVVVAISAVLVVVQQLALRDLRRLEASYISTRKPTACATQALAPGAFSTDQSHLTQNVERIVRQALVEVTAVRERYRHHPNPLGLPQLRSADRAIADAMDAEVALYTAMVSDPTHTEGLLHALGRANTRAEQRLGSIRNLLAAGDTPAWKRRFICDHSV